MASKSKLIVVAECTAKPGQEEALRQLLKTLVEPSRAEAGCLEYTLHENDEEPGKFLFYEIWENDEALLAHSKAPHSVAFGPKVKDLRVSSSLRKFRFSM